VRRGISALFAVAVLVLPGSAYATSSIWTGDFAGDTSTDFSLIFSANGKFNKKGKFISKRVSVFDPAVQFSCFDAVGNVTSASRRDDLAPGFSAGLKVSKKGRFAGTAPTPTGLTYTATGSLRKGKGHGTMQITQGQRGAAGYCSTGTFADPTVSWTAKLIPPVCSGAVPPEGRNYLTCVGP
jgi:hypothetical protein